VPQVKPRPVSGPACRGTKQPWASPGHPRHRAVARGRQAGTDLPNSGRCQTHTHAQLGIFHRGLMVAMIAELICVISL
jgi:hypothetical protein